MGAAGACNSGGLGRGTRVALRERARQQPPTLEKKAMAKTTQRGQVIRRKARQVKVKTARAVKGAGKGTHG